MFGVRVLSNLDKLGIRREIEKIGCSERGIEIMLPKSRFRIVYARGLDPKAANIVKQEFLSAGGEAAVGWEALNMTEEESQIIMLATLRQYKRVLKKLREQPFDLGTLADEIEEALENFHTLPEIPWGGRDQQVMGVLNVTPDSFYDGGKYDVQGRAVERGIEMAEQGADIIDIGGESTRPGSERISLEEERDRVIPIIEKLSEKIEVPISIDTYKPEIAEDAIKAGATIINDIFSLRKEGMVEKVSELDVPVILMHMKGTPKEMQENPTYGDVIADITDFFLERIEYALDAGISRENIILDPGIGFGKKLQHNLEIIRRIDEFSSLGYPVLLGASRKSFLGAILGKEAKDRLYGSLAVASYASNKNVSILRVHDVKETVDALKVVRAIKYHDQG